jgi:hypothetical protein
MAQYKGTKSIQVKQQEIRSLLQNFNWETNPNWSNMLLHMKNEIDDYWLNYLQRQITSKKTINTDIYTYNTR